MAFVRAAIADDSVNETEIARIEAHQFESTAVESEEISNSFDLELLDHLESMFVPLKEGANIVLDGRVTENAWLELEGFDLMRKIDPDTLERAPLKTKTRVFHTTSGLYVSAVMQQPLDSLVSRLSGRDQRVNRDGYSITLDTSGEGTFGFFFGVNLGGTVIDGKVTPEFNFSYQWDGAWRGEAATTDDGWSVEMYIPWSIISMPASVGDRVMGFYVERHVSHVNERYGWPPLPYSAGRFMSALQPIRMQGVDLRQQWDLQPYVSAQEESVQGEKRNRIGSNFSWRPFPNFQMTGTLNPDFGAVESDDVVVNLSAFETFFPEKRSFFLEGSEIFLTSPRSVFQRFNSGVGARRALRTWRVEPTTLLNTRRIGGSAKHVEVPDGVSVEGVELSKPTDLAGAIKIVGQNSGFRYGILSALEKEPEIFGTVDATGEDIVLREDARRFDVYRVLFEPNLESGRKSIGYMGTLLSNPSDSEKVHGIDAHYQLMQGAIGIDGQWIASDVEGTNGYGFMADIRVVPKAGHVHSLQLDYFDDEVDIQGLGFIQRNDLIGGQYFYSYSKSSGLPDWLRTRFLNMYLGRHANTDGKVTLRFIGGSVTLQLQNLSRVRLQYSVRPSFVDDYSSFGDGDFNAKTGRTISASFGTDSAKKWAYSVQTGLRDDQLGHPSRFLDLGFTYTPVSRFRLDWDIRFRKSDGWLVYLGDGDFGTFASDNVDVVTSIDYFITSKQQIRMTMQWTGIDADESEAWEIVDPNRILDLARRIKDETEESDDFAISRMTFQLRYRWEIAPLSDLFVVLTRGSNLSSFNSGYEHLLEGDFQDLFGEAVDEPVVNRLIAKLRYRFGS